MLFNSIEFIIFLAVFYPLFLWSTNTHDRSPIGRHITPFAPASVILLIAGSAFFYGYYNFPYLALIFTSIVVNYVCGSILSRKPSRPLLTAGISFDVLLLCYYKYLDFGVDSFNELFGAAIPLPHVLLPLAVSFFSIQQIMFLVSCHNRATKPRGFAQYVLFILFFPQLIAGPIVEFSDFSRQLNSSTPIRERIQLARGLQWFTFGLAKKVLIADSLGFFVNNAMSKVPDQLTYIDSLIVFLGYPFQIYFDFSGYSQMAIGLGFMFGFKLPRNFNKPFRTTNISDFWSHWHITLSHFIQSYIFFPLMRRFGLQSKVRMLLCITLTMTIAGLWHGANVTFIVFGAMHGLALGWYALVIDQPWQLPKSVSRAITFLFVCASFVFFRSPSCADALAIFTAFSGVLDFNFKSNMTFDIDVSAFAMIFLAMVWCFQLRSFEDLMERLPFIRKPVIAIPMAASVSFAMLAIMTIFGSDSFIYFKF